MESIYTELALYWSKNECARIDTVLYPISEVCDCTVSLNESINDGGVCRTAPATPGLVKRLEVFMLYILHHTFVS